jgi:dienelactone hydrolase
MTTRHAILLITAGLVYATTLTATRGDDVTILKPWLERKLLAPDQTQAEAQDYVESRLPPMPMPANPDDWKSYADRVRRNVLERVVYRGVAAQWRDAKTSVEWLETIDGGAGYRIKKLRYEALPGLWIPALLYEPEQLGDKVPVLMAVNGHDNNGKAAKYKQIRCINLAKRGMLVLNPEWLGMGQLSGDGYKHSRMNQLDLCGTSGLAPFYLSMKRGIDVLLALDHADPDRVAVSGLSGGGWQTITISSLDPRVALCNPVAGYSSFRTRVRNFSDLGDSEQTPCDLATVADYEHLTAILAPRPTLLTYNVKDDCCFAADHALPPLIEAARPIYRMFGKELSLRWHVNHHPGTHNYEIENREAFYRMIGDFFYADKKDFDSQEIACDDELKTKEQLQVEIPSDNENFHTLAKKIAEHLPHVAGTGEKGVAERRKELASLVRAKPLEVVSEQVAAEQRDGVATTFWQLKLGTSWTLPAVEFIRGKPNKTIVVLSDDGRGAAAAQIESLLEADTRVIALDLFYFGECKIQQRAFLFALLIATVGDRALGVQASQLAAVTRWAAGSGTPVSVHTLGPRSAVIGLVAANLEPDRIGQLVMQDVKWSLSDVIQNNLSYEQAPELFCFGLLEEFDSDRLIQLAGSDKVRKN